MEPTKHVESDLAHERSLLGACLLESRLLQRAVTHGVSTESFRDQRHAELFAALVLAAGGAASSATEEPLLATARVLAAQGSSWSITELMDMQRLGGIPEMRFSGALRGLLDGWIRRRAFAALRRGAAQILEGTEPMVDVISRVSGDLHGLAGRGGRRDVRPIAEIVDDLERKARDRIAGNRASQDGIIGTGLAKLDKVSGRMRRGELVVLAARTSSGKSALAVQISRISAEEGRRVGFFTLETRDTSPVARMTQQRCGVSTAKLSEAPVDLVESWFRELRALRALDGLSISEVDHSISAIAGRSRVLKAGKGLDLVVVDYLQLVTSGGTAKREMTREREVAEISRALKLLAVELDVVVLALSQFSRAADDDERPPRLAHLRESGAIEQDADRVLFIWHPARNHAGEDQRQIPGETPVFTDVQVIVAKNREGGTPAAWARFNRGTTSFTEDCT